MYWFYHQKATILQFHTSKLISYLAAYKLIKDDKEYFLLTELSSLEK